MPLHAGQAFGPSYSGASRRQLMPARRRGGALSGALEDAQEVLGPVARALEPVVETVREVVPPEVEAEVRQQTRQNAGVVFLAGVGVGVVGHSLIKSAAGLAVAGGAALLVAAWLVDARSTGAKLAEDRQLNEGALKGYQGVR